MNYIDSLIEHGTHFHVDRKSASATFTPADSSLTGLEAFQTVVEDLMAHQGDGYTIFKTHESRERPGNLVDLVIVAMDEA